MNMKKLEMFALASALSLTLTGCGNTNDQTSVSTANSASSGTASDKVKYSSKTYELYDGDVKFKVPTKLKETENSSAWSDDYYFAIKGSRETVMISTFAFGNQSLKSYSESMAESYKSESDSFSSVSCEPVTLHDHPAYKIVCTDDKDEKCETNIIQFGDNYLVLVVSDAVSGEKNYEYVDALIGSMEFSGEYLRTETEEFDFNSFKLTAEPGWSVWANDGTDESYNDYDYNEEVVVRYDLVDEEPLMFAKFSVKEYKENTDASELADEAYNKALNSDTYETRYKDLERKKDSIFGCEAEVVTYDHLLDKFSSRNTKYFFSKNGKTYQAVFSCWDERYEDFVSELQPIIETFEFKNLFS